MAASGGLFRVPAGEEDVSIDPDLVLSLHEHPLVLSRVVRVPSFVEHFGPSGSYTCEVCKALHYGVVRHCAACHFTVCPNCFRVAREEQNKLVADILAKEKAVLDEEERRQLHRQLMRRRSTKNTGSVTLIMQACIDGNFGVVKEIIDKDDFVHTLDLEEVAEKGPNKGKTALTLATENGHLRIASLLMERGANTEALDNKGMNPLMHAAWNGRVDVLDELLFAGVMVDCVAFCGYTALLFAASRGHHVCVGRLLSANASVTVRTPAGRTALIVAAMNGHITTVELLLRQPIDIEAKDNEGYTARCAAIANNNRHVERIITQRLKEIEAARIAHGAASS